MKRALDIIHDEHRALAAVLSGLSAVVEGIHQGRYEPDFELLDAMIAYVTELPERVHHPKEDHYLFAALRKRCPDATSVLDGLQAQHREGPAKTLELLRALKRFRIGGASELPAFRKTVRSYVDDQWQHMSTEETKVLPLASNLLTPRDWAGIDAAFGANDNPWDGPAGVYRQLFTRIVTLAPAPIGVGDAGGPKH